ncbi:MAG: GNAT family N-acetyltransferase [Oscillospiraceae bacterium]
MICAKAALLFDNWDEALIWSCLQGYMGTMSADDEHNPRSAVIDIGDFCFCAGTPDENLFCSITGSKLLVPKDGAWGSAIEHFFGKRAKKTLRYATKKEPAVFCKNKLISYVAALDACYDLTLFNRETFEAALRERWSADLCSQFRDYADYQSRAIGVAVLHQGNLVAGASPYAIYRNGIEIEIDTHPEYRCQGLATVCGAKLILDCLSRNIYPSWDAHDLRSVHLAEKLGYHLSHPYITYEIEPE